MIKIKSIISSLQSFEPMYLDASQSEFILKESANVYMICHSDIDESIRFVDLTELKSFIYQNENLFIDMFSSDSKYVYSNFKKSQSSDIECEESAKYWLENNKEVETISTPDTLTFKDLYNETIEMMTALYTIYQALTIFANKNKISKVIVNQVITSLTTKLVTNNNSIQKTILILNPK